MRVLFGLPGSSDKWLDPIEHAVAATRGTLSMHRYPDGETGVRLDTPVAERDAILVCALHRPDAKLPPLLFAADAARELGARRVGLIAPYLPYLRQDRRFSPGEAITSRTFARLLSSSFDWLVTVDPHLHRYPTLDAVYTIPSVVAHAADAIGTWIRDEVPAPLVVGPDGESEQWAAAVANAAGAPHVVLRKERLGDTDVRLSVPDLTRWPGRTPVLIDDIVSTAGTMIAAVDHLKQAGLPLPVCVAVHAIFAGDAYEALRRAGARRIVSCDTVPHPSNAIFVGPLLAGAVAAAVRREPG